MIREATLVDIPAMMPLLREARDGCGLNEPDGVNGFWFPYDPAVAEQQLRHHLTSGQSFCRVYEADGGVRGVFIGEAYNYRLGPIRIAAEVTFWVTPNYRGRGPEKMLEEFERWAKTAMGCQYSDITSKSDRRFEKWIERRGYCLLEKHYVKAL